MYQGPGDLRPPRMTRPPPEPRMQGKGDGASGIEGEGLGGGLPGACTLVPQVAPGNTFTSALSAMPYWANSACSGGGRVGAPGGGMAAAGGGAAGGEAAGGAAAVW